VIYKKNAHGLLGALLGCASLFGLELVAMPAHAAPTVTQQVLDRVFAFGPNRVIDMATGNAARPPDFTDLGISGSSFSTCALTAVSGLYCLDGKSLRNWPNPTDPAHSSEILNCSDAALDLDRKSDCTGMTVDQNGTIWLAGKRHNAHSLIKVVAKGTGCPSAAYATLAGGSLCALEMYSGRPVLVDITPIDGDAADDFPKHAGILGLEERKNAVFYPDSTGVAPTVLVSGKEWGLSGKELLQEITLLQIPNGGVVDNYIVATTSNGRILAKNVALSGTPRQVFSIPAQRGAAARCNADEQQYGIRSSSTSDILFVSDRNYCQVLALQPDSAAFNNLVKLQRNGVDFVLSTAITDTTPNVFYPSIGIAVAPGVSILLSDCKVSCAIVNSSTGSAAAKLESVQLVNESNSGATVFQVKGIPDCRYAAVANFTSELAALCNAPGVTVNPDAQGFPDPGAILCAGATCPASAQWLNVTPLLPSQVISAFKASGNGVLPALLVSPPYRGQMRNGYTFEALFVLTSPTIQYRNIFNGEYDVPGLEGSLGSLGCTPNSARLIDWDLVTTVSEFYVGYGGKNVDMLTNSGCGSTKTVGVRLSLLPYDLEPTPDTWGPAFGGTGQPVLTTNNDAVFARLLQRLYGELSYAQRELACKQVDPVPNGGVAPLSASNCSSLDSVWENGKQKLDKCIAAGFQPKQSAGNENCQSFISQLNNYQTQIPASTPAWDVANRVGELKARIVTLLHVYYTRYVPSIPANGFCRETTNCTSPW